jgi:hypothetical protein
MLTRAHAVFRSPSWQIHKRTALCVTEPLQVVRPPGARRQGLTQQSGAICGKRPETPSILTLWNATSARTLRASTGATLRQSPR